MAVTGSEAFWRIHSGLPREGPGDYASTRRAYAALSGLPAEPRILDVGCGPGMQTIELARISGGRITAIDTHQPFLDELKRRAIKAGVSDRITTRNISMFEMPFADGSFDLIWSEGAIYFIGLKTGLHEWRRLLMPGGFVAVTYPCWLTTDIPPEVGALWRDENFTLNRPETDIAAAERVGYRLLDHFTLPPSAWWDDYYLPIEEKLPALRQEFADNAKALRVVEEAQREIDVFRVHPDVYAYVFFVMRRTD